MAISTGGDYEVAGGVHGTWYGGVCAAVRQSAGSVSLASVLQFGTD